MRPRALPGSVLPSAVVMRTAALFARLHLPLLGVRALLRVHVVLQDVVLPGAAVLPTATLPVPLLDA